MMQTGANEKELGDLFVRIFAHLDFKHFDCKYRPISSA